MSHGRKGLGDRRGFPTGRLLGRGSSRTASRRAPSSRAGPPRARSPSSQEGGRGSCPWVVSRKLRLAGPAAGRKGPDREGLGDGGPAARDVRLAALTVMSRADEALRDAVRRSPWKRELYFDATRCPGVGVGGPGQAPPLLRGPEQETDRILGHVTQPQMVPSPPPFLCGKPSPKILFGLRQVSIATGVPIRQRVTMAT